jgi:hypothetical protein
MKLAIIITFGIFWAGIGQSHADDIRTGNDIKEECQLVIRDAKTNLDAVKASYCVGFMRAILYTGEYLEAQYRFCPPSRVTVEQATSVFLKYLNANPEQTHLAPENLAVTALRRAWPCK